MARNRIIGVRVDDEQSEKFERAAKVAGRSVSDRLRDLGMRAVTIPATLPVINVHPSAYPESTVELAKQADARIGRSVADFLAKTRIDSPNNPNVPMKTAEQLYREVQFMDEVGCNEPIVQYETRPWYPVLMKLKQTGEHDPGTAAEDFNTLLGVDRPFRPPKGWATWDVRKQAVYLDEHHPLEVRDAVR